LRAIFMMLSNIPRLCERRTSGPPQLGHRNFESDTVVNSVTLPSLGELTRADLDCDTVLEYQNGP